MELHLNSIEIPTTLALAIMATLGYVFGTLQQRRRAGTNEAWLRLKNELSRAQMAVSEMETVIGLLRKISARHHSRLKRFQRRVAGLGNEKGDAVWHKLCQEVESILEPSVQLVQEIANSQDRIRYQSSYLMTFSEVRTDPLTGLGNRRALDHVLSAQFSMLHRYGTSFALAVIDIDHFKEINDQHGHLHGDQVLRDLTKLLTDALRRVDIVARYGGDELVVVMPQTDLVGGAALGQRLRTEVEQKMSFTVSVGVASACDTDTPETLFRRADEAMYRAKSDGRNRMVCDGGPAGDAARHEAAMEAC